MAVKKDMQEKIAWLQTLFKPIMGKPVVVTFGTHKAEGVTIIAVEPKPITGFKLAPEKRPKPNGKGRYGPPLIRIGFHKGNGSIDLGLVTYPPEDTFELVLVDEDTTWTAITNGVRATVGPVKIEMRLMDDNATKN